MLLLSVSKGVYCCRFVSTCGDFSGFSSTFVYCCRHLVTPVYCDPFPALLPIGMMLYVQQYSRHVYAKRLPGVLGQTRRQSARNQICPHSISTSWNRSGAELRPAPESRLGSAAKGRATNELSQFSQDRFARQKNEESNRAQKTVHAFSGPSFAGNGSETS